jgi:hypothetical protein
MYIYIYVYTYIYYILHTRHRQPGVYLVRWITSWRLSSGVVERDRLTYRCSVDVAMGFLTEKGGEDRVK